MTGKSAGFTPRRTAGIDTHLAVCLGKALTVADQAASLDKLAAAINCWNCVACSKPGKAVSRYGEEGVGADEQRQRAPRVGQGREGLLDALFAVCLDHMQLQPGEAS